MSHTSYVPPHPQRGTPYHRYIILLLPQPSTDHLSMPKLLDNDRLGFNVRDFLLRYQLDGGKGGGAHMWREVWDTKVSEIYQKVLSKFYSVICV
jgi:large subunit ribosomal protein L35